MNAERTTEEKLPNHKQIEQVYRMRDEINNLRRENSRLNRKCFLLETLTDAIGRADNRGEGYASDGLLDVSLIREKLISEGSKS